MDQAIRLRVESNVALVEHIVTRMAAGFPDHIERDDLVQAGMLALVETAGRYDPDRGVAFSTFAGRRIEGAILDVIRHDDWLPRSLRAKSRELSNVEQDLLKKNGATPDHRMVAAAADMSVKELSDLRSKVRRGVVMALDRPMNAGDGNSTLGDTLADRDGTDLGDELEAREMKAYIRSAIHLLPPRHRAVIVGYFLEERPMDELGALLGVTQSRISQIKDDALRRIREGLHAQYNDAPVEPSRRRRDRSRQEYARAIAEDSTAASRLQSVSLPPL